MNLPSRIRLNLVIAEYKVLAWLAKRLPRCATTFLENVAGWLGPLFFNAKRHIVAIHIGKITGQYATRAQVRAAFKSYVRYWFDAFRVTTMNETQVGLFMSTRGFEHVKTAREQGNGVILALPHMGNWDVAGAWFVAQGIPLTVVAEELNPPELFEWFARFRSSFGLNVVANSNKVGGILLQALKRNEAIALLCDRDVDGTGGEYEFFGEVTRIPKGPATLALRSGAALLPAAVFENGQNYRTQIMPPLTIERQGRLGDDVNRITQELVTSFESLIREAPEQWHVFQPNWPSMSNDKL